jgi:hypothetical protein
MLETVSRTASFCASGARKEVAECEHDAKKATIRMGISFKFRIHEVSKNCPFMEASGQIINASGQICKTNRGKIAGKN